MYLAVDMGGTKVLMAVFDDNGNLVVSKKFPTNKVYSEFLKEFRSEFEILAVDNIHAAGIAIPGMIDRVKGVAVHFGNLDWTNVPIRADLAAILPCPVVLENDAKAGALYQAFNISNEFKKVLYIAVGTGVGVAYVSNGVLDTSFGDDGGRSMMYMQDGRSISWDRLASGKAIVERFGKKASEITDPEAWKIIAHNLAVGIADLLDIFETEVIVFGGGVGAHLDKFESYLNTELSQMLPAQKSVPPIRLGVKPEEAVIYGGYALAKQVA